MQKIRTIMFEDNRKFRESITLLVDSTDDMVMIKGFENANEAWKQVRNHAPDVILMDIEMPGSDGITALSDIRSKAPEQKVLMLTSFEDEHKIFAAICAGASGYAIKGDIDHLEQGIRDVYAGGGHFSPSIALRVMQMLRNPLVAAQKTYVALTKRETEVLQKLVEGNSRKMIAACLELKLDTIGDYIKEIYRKLHVNSAPEAVREAIVRRLV
jgi:DNA-binding NarL/FixJ family response regulator